MKAVNALLDKLLRAIVVLIIMAFTVIPVVEGFRFAVAPSIAIIAKGVAYGISFFILSWLIAHIEFMLREK